MRVVFVGVRILNLSLKSAPPKNDTCKRVCFGKGAAQSTFLVELHNLGHVPSEMKKMKKPVLGGGDFKLGFKILIPTKTVRKAATNRFVVSPLVLDCVKGSYMGVFRGFNLNHVILSLKSKLHLDFTNVPLAVH